MCFVFLAIVKGHGWFEEELAGGCGGSTLPLPPKPKSK